MNRRGFLKAFVSSVALAVIPATPALAAALREPAVLGRRDLEALLKAGPVMGKTFLLTDGLPVTLHPSAVLVGCSFKWLGPEPRCLINIDGSDSRPGGGRVEFCHFDSSATDTRLS